ncbi:sigma-70 family RNA polymerase sigma factor [Bacillus luteolus]|uniref:Sigma-70 family RNA polymerase sigma factor n=1 Tax=Litchfieldia luteola TaxID=682179 RepID=A0ABR9QMM6_9BACI|nr:sigma-70 family RNA polymerase sigma factor [Cytobacillus luteolus]
MHINIQLVKKAQKGNEDAFLELFQMYEVDLYKTAFVYLKNKEEALDAVQETAYRSFKSINNLKEPKYFKTWIIRIVISCSMDILRKRQKVVYLYPEYEETVKDTEEDDIPLSLTLKDLVENLNHQEKGVIVLRFYYDYTLKEIAEIQDLPLGTVKTILYRSLKKLRQYAKEGQLYEQ